MHLRRVINSTNIITMRLEWRKHMPAKTSQGPRHGEFFNIKSHVRYIKRIYKYYDFMYILNRAINIMIYIVSTFLIREQKKPNAVPTILSFTLKEKIIFLLCLSVLLYSVHFSLIFTSLPLSLSLPPSPPSLCSVFRNI